MAAQVEVSITREDVSSFSPPSLSHSSSSYYASCEENIQYHSSRPTPSPPGDLTESSGQSEPLRQHHVQRPPPLVAQQPVPGHSHGQATSGGRGGRGGHSGRGASGGRGGCDDSIPLVQARQNPPRSSLWRGVLVAVTIVFIAAVVIILSLFTVLWYVTIAPATKTDHLYISNHEVLRIDSQWFTSRALTAELPSAPTDRGKVKYAKGSCSDVNTTSIKEHQHASQYYTANHSMQFGSIRFVVHLLKDGYVRISFILSSPYNTYTLYYGVLGSHSGMLAWEEQCNSDLHSDDCVKNGVTVFHPNTHSETKFIFRNSSSLDDDVEHVYITARLDSSSIATWPVGVAVDLIAVTQDYLMPNNMSNCTGVSGAGDGGGDGVSGDGDGGGDGVQGGEGAAEGEVVCSVGGHDDILGALTDSRKCVYIDIHGEDFLIHNTLVQYHGRIDFPLYFIALPVFLVLVVFVIYCCVRVLRR